MVVLLLLVLFESVCLPLKIYFGKYFNLECEKETAVCPLANWYHEDRQKWGEVFPLNANCHCSFVPWINVSKVSHHISYVISKFNGFLLLPVKSSDWIETWFSDIFKGTTMDRGWYFDLCESGLQRLTKADLYKRHP